MPILPIHALVSNFLTLVERLFAETAQQNISLAVPLQTASVHLRAVQLMGEPALSPRVLPVCRYLPLALTAGKAIAGLADALQPLLPALAWIQNPNYQPNTIPPTFLDNYGYADIISRRGLFAADALAMGILLLGPHTEYPPHVHPAAEIYYTIGGACHCWQTGQAWTQQGAGSVVYHPSGVVHAMRTLDEPVCLLYIWWGDVQIAARLTQSEGCTAKMKN